MTRLAPLVLAGLLVSLAGCPDNPYKASTWTKKLNDPREAERAVTQLEQLGDPSAIEALGQAWQEQGKPVRLLQVIISLARPLTPEQAKAQFVTDYEKTGRPANWDKAMPFLSKALTEVDDANPRSVDSAQKAADALGESAADGGLDALVDIAGKPVTKKLIAAQVSSIRAIGKYTNEKAKAAAALVKIIDRDPPPHPRTAKDKENARALEEKYGLYLGVTGASINALGDLRATNAVKTLVRSMYLTPELFTQIRRALVASGPEAETALRKILTRQDPDIAQLFKDKKLDVYCGDHGDAPADQCQPVSAMDFYPAVVLGDFYDPASVPDLLAVLDRPMAPQYYQDDAPSGSTQFNAVFDSLRKIGAASAAPKVRSMWDKAAPAPAAAPKAGKKGAPAAAAPAAGADTDINTRILAVGAYPFVAHDDAGVDELGKIAFDNHADLNLRTEAATAFARLSHDPAHIKELNDLADQYYKQAADYRAKADAKPKADADAADKEFEAARKKKDDAKANALKATNDKSKTADDIRAAAEAAKKAEDDFKVAQGKHKDALKPFKDLDTRAKGLKYTGRMFQTHIARIEVALRCKSDQSCYVATLKSWDKPDTSEAKKNVSQYIKDIDTWTKDELMGLYEGEIERAMLELGKLGQSASATAPQLLDAAKSEDRLVRQSILLALPKVAKIPCDTCEAKLDEAIKAGEGKSTLGDLNLETTMLRNYFSYAGGKTPSAPAPDVPAAPAPAAPKAKKK
jgi:predicted  nucleic acid-binding Zn-ribbon protein